MKEEVMEKTEEKGEVFYLEIFYEKFKPFKLVEQINEREKEGSRLIQVISERETSEGNICARCLFHKKV